MKTNLKTIEKRNTTNSTEQKLITKIKLDDNFANINVCYKSKESEKMVTYKGKEEVTEKFKTSLNQLKTTLINIIPFLENVNYSNITINGIKIEYYDNGNLKKVMLLAHIKLSDEIESPLICNTPLINVYSPSLTSNVFYICGKDEKYIHELIQLAFDYMKGDTKTKQLSLVVNNEDN